MRLIKNETLIEIAREEITSSGISHIGCRPDGFFTFKYGSKSHIIIWPTRIRKAPDWPEIREIAEEHY